MLQTVEAQHRAGVVRNVKGLNSASAVCYRKIRKTRKIVISTAYLVLPAYSLIMAISSVDQ